MANRDQIKSTKTAFELLDVIAEIGGATAADITARLDISRTSVYKHLRTLVSLDAVENEDGTFVLGPKIIEYAEQNRTDASPFVQNTAKIDTLAVSLDAPVNLWLPDGEHCVCRYTTLPNEGRENPRDEEECVLLVDSVPGKTILAQISPEERESMLEEHSDGRDMGEIQSQLQVVRERRILIESLAPEDHWYSIATPVTTLSRDPRGALEVVIPSERAKGIDVEVNIAGLLLDTANNLEAEAL